MRGLGRYYQRANGTWAIAYYVNGREVRESVARLLRRPPRQVTWRDAERALKLRFGQRHGGRFVGPDGERLTVAQIADSYLAHCRVQGLKSVRDIANVLRHVRRAFGAERAVDVTAARLEAWAAELIDRGRPRGTVQLYLSYFRAAMNFVRRQGRLTSLPVFPTIEVQNARQGFLERDEVAKICAELMPDYADVVQFAYLSGWRRTEVLTLPWSAVDRARGVVRLPDSKNGEGRLLPLCRQDGALNAVGELLERRWRRRGSGSKVCPWVFHRAGRPIARNTLWEAWQRATAAAGLPGKLLHDLRRTAARDLIAAGNDYKTAMDLTGHRTMAVFHRYQIGDVRLAQRGLDRLEAYRQPAAVVSLGTRTKHGQNAQARRASP